MVEYTQTDTGGYASAWLSAYTLILLIVALLTCSMSGSTPISYVQETERNLSSPPSPPPLASFRQWIASNLYGRIRYVKNSLNFILLISVLASIRSCRLVRNCSLPPQPVHDHEDSTEGEVHRSWSSRRASRKILGEYITCMLHYNTGMYGSSLFPLVDQMLGFSI